MTKGIIQQVCEKFIRDNQLPYISKSVAYMIEQELIEFIQKYNAPFLSKDELIGDGK